VDGDTTPDGTADRPSAQHRSDDEQPFPAPDTVPPRSAFVLAYVGIVLAGLLGGAIGYGLVDVGCRGHCGTARAFGALAGGLVAAAGGGVVAVLVLRAMHLWRVPHDEDDDAGGERQAPNVRRRKPSA